LKQPPLRQLNPSLACFARRSSLRSSQSDKVKDIETTFNLFKYATEVTGAEWSEVSVAKSPCPTLKVVGLVTAAINAKEEAKRMKPEPGMVGAIDLKAKAANNFDFITQGTVVKAVKAVQDKFLGDLPEDAVKGSYQSERNVDDAVEHNVSVSPSLEDTETMKRRLNDLIEKGELNCTDNPELCGL
jgi:hypothetical protein